jgi:hypothetical protein
MRNLLEQGSLLKNNEVSKVKAELTEQRKKIPCKKSDFGGTAREITQADGWK